MVEPRKRREIYHHACHSRSGRVASGVGRADALRVLDECLKLRTNVLNDASAELPHVRAAAKWAGHLPKAAHLIPFNLSRNDKPTNGMALCPNHHWAMDRHLIAPVPDRKKRAGVWRVNEARLGAM